MLLKQTKGKLTHLSTHQISIWRTTLQQLLMPSTSHHHSILTHEDHVTVHDRAQTMRHSHHSTRMTLPPTIQCLQELLLVLAVQRTRRLVQQQNRGVTQNRTRQRQSLFLTTRHGLARRAQIRLKPIRHLVDEVHAQRLLAHTLQLLFAHSTIHAHQQILTDRSTEHHGLLIHHAQQTTVPVQI